MPDVAVDHYAGYSNKMTTFHRHSHYEISIILSGSMRILTESSTVSGKGSKLTLIRPWTAHFVSFLNEESPELYERVNVNFGAELLSDVYRDFGELVASFSVGGRVLEIERETAEKLATAAKSIEEEPHPFRKRLLLMYLLSLIAEVASAHSDEHIPSYVGEAMGFIAEHFNEKIVAADLARRLGVGRTTLMTTFRQYTGMTLNNYIIGCRLNAALKLLRAGGALQETAEKCGFSDACALVRTFKAHYGLPPLKYLKAGRNAPS